jgi:hypothetical protein
MTSGCAKEKFRKWEGHVAAGVAALPENLESTGIGGYNPRNIYFRGTATKFLERTPQDEGKNNSRNRGSRRGHEGRREVPARIA